MTTQTENSPPAEFNYMLLSRLQLDCNALLAGSIKSNKIWGMTIPAHIAKMKELLDNFPNDKKPEWISLNDIEDFEISMIKYANLHYPQQ